MKMKAFTALAFLAAGAIGLAAEGKREIIPAKEGGRTVPDEKMKAIYEEVKTPYKSTPISPPSGPATGYSNGLHPKSNFLGASLSPVSRGWRS